MSILATRRKSAAPAESRPIEAGGRGRTPVRVAVL
jgi:hypothetical protein